MARSASSESSVAHQLAQGQQVERQDAGKLRGVLKKMSRLSGDAAWATGELSLLMNRLEGQELMPALERYLELLKSNQGADPEGVREVFFQLEESDRQDQLPQLASLMPHLAGPQESYQHLGWIQQEFSEPKKRLEAVEWTGKLSPLDLDLSQTQTALKHLMAAQKPGAELDRLHDFLNLERDFGEAMADLEAAGRSKSGTRLLKDLKRYHPDETPTARAAVSLVLADPEHAPTRERALRKLAAAQGSLEPAAEDLKFLLEQGGDEKLKESTGHLLDLMDGAGPERRLESREVFPEYLKLLGQGETFWQKIGLATSREDVFQEMARVHDSPKEALRDLAFLEEQLDGRGYGGAVKVLAGLNELGGGAELARQAFKRVHQQDGVFGSAGDRFKTLSLIARDVGSLSMGMSALQALTDGAEPREYDQRLGTLYHLLDLDYEGEQAVAYLGHLRDTAAQGVRPLFETLMADHLDNERLMLAPQMAEVATLFAEVSEPSDQLLPLVTMAREPQHLTKIKEFLVQDPNPRTPVLANFILNSRVAVDTALAQAEMVEAASEPERFLENLTAFSGLSSVFEQPRPGELKDHFEWAAGVAKTQGRKTAAVLKALAEQLIINPEDVQAARQVVMDSSPVDTDIVQDEDYLIVGDFAVERQDD